MSNLRFSLAWAVVTSMVLPWCSAAGESSGGGARTCDDQEQLSTCTRYSPDAFDVLGEEVVESLCDLGGGTWGTRTCPTQDAVGVCDDGNGTVVTYYATGGDPHDRASAESACADMMGAFSPRGKGGSGAAEAPLPAETAPAAPTRPRSCDDRPKLGICTDYQPAAMALLGEDFYRDVCQATGGTWNTEACPAGKRVGSCDDGEGTRMSFYSAGGVTYDEEGAREACANMAGSFRTGR